MINLKNGMKRTLSFYLAVLMLFSAFTMLFGVNASAVVESVGGSDSLVRTSLNEIKSVLTSIVYSEYLQKHSAAANASSELTVNIFDLIESMTTATTDKANGSQYGTDGDILLTGDDGKVTFSIDIPADAFYNIQIEYWTGNLVMEGKNSEIISGKGSTIERMLLIDDKVPFKEARSVVLTRQWIDTYFMLNDDYKIIDKTDTFDSVSDYFHKKAIEGIRIFQRDNNGNEIKPEKNMYADWVTTSLHDSTGYYPDALNFFFSEGTHTLTLSTVKEPLAIKSIKFVPQVETISYDEYISKHEAAGAKDYAGGEKVIIQAEYPTLTSDRSLYQLNDRSSVITQPQDSSLVRLNAIGGDKWTYTWQWIEYSIEVPEDGFYTIVPRSIQDINSGMYSSRRIYINGEIPFVEASYLRFDFSDNWRTADLNDGTTNFKFYLKKGIINTIRFEVVLGDLSKQLSIVEKCLSDANAYYRKILMVTGPDPDEFRDYNFKNILPDVLKGLKRTASELNAVAVAFTELTGSSGENTGALLKAALNMERMGNYPEKIAVTLGTLKDQLAALGSWLTGVQSQPLKFDYISIQAVSAEKPKADANFWQKFIGEIKKFWVSFFADYNSVSSSINEENAEQYSEAAIEVWTSSSRDHAQIIRSLVDDEFMNKYNIPVNVKLVDGGTLLPATLAGTGPDIAMGQGQETPINYAIRSAVLSLNSTNNGYDFNDFSKYKDNPVYKDIIDDVDTFDEVFERFAPAAKVPLTLYGETYGVPENMGFSMMFYRKDIFVELDIEVPNTWDQFNEVITALQVKKVDIGFPTGVGGSTILMYQQDETMYKEGGYEEYLTNYPDLFADGKNTYTDADGNVIPKTDGMEINLDSIVSLTAFKKVCQYFTMYDFPVTYTFADRFRNGTMPLAIADYTTYNQLIIFAPEIKGLWEFTPLPGTLREDKTINNTTPGSVTAMIMMRGVTEANNFSAWIFMQWWTSAETQSSFANEMEALLGPSAKQNTANLEALESMAWSRDELDNLKAQFNAVTCTPQYPGSYIMGRYAGFAFNDVYNKKTEPVETLRKQIDAINAELTRKRKEFNLITKDDLNALDSEAEAKKN